MYTPVCMDKLKYIYYCIQRTVSSGCSAEYVGNPKMILQREFGSGHRIYSDIYDSTLMEECDVDPVYPA